MHRNTNFRNSNAVLIVVMTRVCHHSIVCNHAWSMAHLSIRVLKFILSDVAKQEGRWFCLPIRVTRNTSELRKRGFWQSRNTNRLQTRTIQVWAGPTKHHDKNNGSYQGEQEFCAASKDNILLSLHDSLHRKSSKWGMLKHICTMRRDPWTSRVET